MSDVSLSGGNTPHPPPIPVIPLEYRTERIDVGPWVMVARLPTTAAWHQARSVLARGQIESLMGEGEEAPSSEGTCTDSGIALMVPQADAPCAQIILEHCAAGQRWCPRCGSDQLQPAPVPWYWVIWSILFLGIAPFAPPRWVCCHCGKRIE